MKYHHNLNERFAILIHFKMDLIPGMAKLSFQFYSFDAFIINKVENSSAAFLWKLSYIFLGFFDKYQV